MPCIVMYEDNEGAIHIAKHPISNSNSKHIDVRHHFLRGLVEKKEIDIIHVSTEYQHADFLTKALPEKEFAFHRGIVMKIKHHHRGATRTNLLHTSCRPKSHRPILKQHTRTKSDRCSVTVNDLRRTLGIVQKFLMK